MKNKEANGITISSNELKNIITFLIAVQDLSSDLRTQFNNKKDIETFDLFYSNANMIGGLLLNKYKEANPVVPKPHLRLIKGGKDAS